MILFFRNLIFFKYLPFLRILGHSRPYPATMGNNQVLKNSFHFTFNNDKNNQIFTLIALDSNSDNAPSPR
jgi:hypothetical protein